MLVVDLLDGLVDVLGFQPSSFRMKAGDLLSFTARVSEKITSSGRTDCRRRRLCVGQREGQALAVGAGFPGGCERRLDLGRVVAVGLMRR
jgi:hypothetical protein